MNTFTENLLIDRNSAELSIFWLGGAGFLVNYRGLAIGIDVYLSDACRNEDGSFKRMIPAPVSANDLELDYLVATHEHGDHFDKGSVNVLLKNAVTKLIGPSSVQRAALACGIKGESIIVLNRGERRVFYLFEIEAVSADHGTQSPDAVGIILKIDGRTIYFTGDTCYNRRIVKAILKKSPIDCLILPINGRYGNLGSKEAARLVRQIKPRAVIPCHYWLFIEHGGDPAQFQKSCERLGHRAALKILAIGEPHVIRGDMA